MFKWLAVKPFCLKADEMYTFNKDGEKWELSEAWISTSAKTDCYRNPQINETEATTLVNAKINMSHQNIKMTLERGNGSLKHLGG